MNDQVEFISAVLLVSDDAPGLAAFYRDVLGFPLEDEVHGGSDLHYGCELGDVHFAIHPRSNFDSAKEPQSGSINLAFAVFDMEAFVARVEQAGGSLLYPPRDSGFAIMTALEDPDGNLVEFTQLSEGWMAHLEKRRQEGKDILAQWRAQSRRSDSAE